MFYRRGKSRKWTSPVSAWVAALFALVQVVAMAHHAGHDADDFTGPAEVAARAAQAAGDMPQASPAAGDAAHRAPEMRRIADVAAARDLCVACLLSSSAQSTLTPDPRPLVAPMTVAWPATRFPGSTSPAAARAVMAPSGRAPPFALAATA